MRSLLSRLPLSYSCRCLRCPLALSCGHCTFFSFQIWIKAGREFRRFPQFLYFTLGLVRGLHLKIQHLPGQVPCQFRFLPSHYSRQSVVSCSSLFASKVTDASESLQSALILIPHLNHLDTGPAQAGIEPELDFQQTKQFYLGERAPASTTRFARKRARLSITSRKTIWAAPQH